MIMIVYDAIGNIFYSKQVITSANNTLYICDIPVDSTEGRRIARIGNNKKC